MASALPHRHPVDHTPREQTDVVVDSGESTDVLQALTSDTAQAIVAALREEPKPPSEIAEVVDTSVQNAQYHLEHLLEAGLVEQVDTWYSSRGLPMTVYALASERLVVELGPEKLDE